MDISAIQYVHSALHGPPIVASDTKSDNMDACERYRPVLDIRGDVVSNSEQRWRR